MYDVCMMYVCIMSLSDPTKHEVIVFVFDGERVLRITNIDGRVGKYIPKRSKFSSISDDRSARMASNKT